MNHLYAVTLSARQQNAIGEFAVHQLIVPAQTAVEARYLAIDYARAEHNLETHHIIGVNRVTVTALS